MTWNSILELERKRCSISR